LRSSRNAAVTECWWREVDFSACERTPVADETRFAGRYQMQCRAGVGLVHPKRTWQPASRIQNSAASLPGLVSRPESGRALRAAQSGACQRSCIARGRRGGRIAVGWFSRLFTRRPRWTANPGSTTRLDFRAADRMVTILKTCPIKSYGAFNAKSVGLAQAGTRVSSVNSPARSPVCRARLTAPGAAIFFACAYTRVVGLKPLHSELPRRPSVV